MLTGALVLAACSGSVATNTSTGPTVSRSTTVDSSQSASRPSYSGTPVDEAGATTSTSGDSDEGGCPEELEDGSSIRLEGDIDGDGRSESIAVDRLPIGETTIRVCGSDAGSFHVGDFNKPAEVYVIDVGGDGVVELLVGGPTGAARFSGSIVRLVDSELTDLGLSLTVVNAGRTGTSFGCVDVDDDGFLELVSLSYEFDADPVDAATSVTWTRTVVLDNDAVDQPTVKGTFDTRAQPNAVIALLNGTCGDDTIIEGPSE